ncbi:MAG: histidine phosphatase family protein [Anaerolineae bacterium]|nr:histidine phosphatase family protein [Gemmatimonadaceae bacterium]
MAASILLVRHGPSAHLHTAGAIDRTGLQQWFAAYDTAGIAAATRPPTALLQKAAEATRIVASDLPRAVTSAEQLAPNRPIVVSALLRETSLAIPHWPTRLPLGAWAVLIHLGWTYRMVRGPDPHESDRDRAATAAELLAGMVADGSTALVVTHGVFRRVLAQQLLRLGWTCTGRRGGYRHWSCWSFTRPGGNR